MSEEVEKGQLAWAVLSGRKVDWGCIVFFASEAEASACAAIMGMICEPGSSDPELLLTVEELDGHVCTMWERNGSGEIVEEWSENRVKIEQAIANPPSGVKPGSPVTVDVW